MSTVDLKIGGITCTSCASRIRGGPGPAPDRVADEAGEPAGEEGSLRTRLLVSAALTLPVLVQK